MFCCPFICMVGALRPWLLGCAERISIYINFPWMRVSPKMVLFLTTICGIFLPAAVCHSCLSCCFSLCLLTTFDHCCYCCCCSLNLLQPNCLIAIIISLDSCSVLLPFFLSYIYSLLFHSLYLVRTD